MRKSFFSFFAGLLALIFILILGISGCGGGNGTSVGTASTVTVTPASLSLDFGQVAQLSTTVKDAGGNTILTLTPTYSSSSSSVTVSTGGLVCAGTWDSLTIPVVCTPAISVG